MNPDNLNFLDKDTRFKPLQSTQDNYFHQFHASGVGKQVQHAEIISPEEKGQLWTTETLTTATSKGLLHVFIPLERAFVFVADRKTIT